MVSGYSSVTNFNLNVFDAIAIVQEGNSMPTLKGAYIVVRGNEFGHFERLDGESNHAMKKRMTEHHVRQATLEEIYHLAVSFLQQSSLNQIQRNKILNIVSLIETKGYDKWNDLSKNSDLAKGAESDKKLTNGLKLLDQLLKQYIISDHSISRVSSFYLRSRGCESTNEDVTAIQEVLQKTVSLYSPFDLKSRIYGGQLEVRYAKPYQIMLQVLLQAETQGLKEAHAAVDLMFRVMPQQDLIADTDGLVCEALRNDNLAIFEDLMRRGTKLAGEALKHAVQYSSIKTLNAVVTHVKKQELHKRFSVGLQKEILDQMVVRGRDGSLASTLAFEHLRAVMDQNMINIDQINVSSCLMWREDEQWMLLSLSYLAQLGVDLVFHVPGGHLLFDTPSSVEWDQYVKYAEMIGAIGVRPAIPKVTWGSLKYVQVKGSIEGKPIYLRDEIDGVLKQDMERGEANYIEINNARKALYALWDAMEKGYQTRRQVYERVVELVSEIGLHPRDIGKHVMEYLFGDEEVQISNMPTGVMEYVPIKLSSGNPEADQKSFKYTVGETELTRMTILSMARLHRGYLFKYIK